LSTSNFVNDNDYEDCLESSDEAEDVKPTDENNSDGLSDSGSGNLRSKDKSTGETD